jgi:hypothetical protein
MLKPLVTRKELAGYLSITPRAFDNKMKEARFKGARVVVSKTCVRYDFEKVMQIFKEGNAPM